MAPTRKRARYHKDELIIEELPDISLLTPKESSDVEATTLSDVPPPTELSIGAIHHLYSNSTVGKLWGIATKALQQPKPPIYFPEYTKPGGTKYVYRELDFWTSGFFPGSLHLLLERQRNFKATGVHEQHLEWWTESLHQNAHLSTTHDLGFMIAPWAKVAWDLNHDYRALETMKTAAKTLHGRFSKNVGLIRSWDTCVTKRYEFLDPDNEFLTVIDNMMNLDLLFYVAQQTGNGAMYEAAAQHARTTQQNHIRDDFSTIHLVTFDPNTGGVRERLTNQGYTDTSCWTRGQAWAIAGFAETYNWTHDRSFLETAVNCADYFLHRLPESGVPPWDFDAEDDAKRDGKTSQAPDVSAAMITAYGLLLIHKALVSLGKPSKYLNHALRLVNAVTMHHINPPSSFIEHTERIEMVERPTEDVVTVSVEPGGAETILNGATINNHEFAPRRWANHGLVYADYYFLLVGNELLKMDVGGLVGRVTPFKAAPSQMRS
ncbi:hypothetical protein TruAng_001947 [Truncatella angustata]|nr:hypothetical protein TruAng_001947 [Truncatella angustata]